jgi:allene oxide cyclase
MRKSSLLSMSVASLAAVILTAGIARAEGMETLALVEHAASDAVTDTGAEGDSAGDLLTFANEIFDKDNATKLGTDSGWCIRVAPGQSWECFWTLTLVDGQITVEGPFLDVGDSVLAVTGGTGKYAGARGEMALHARNDKGTEYDFNYKLTY